MFGSNRQVFIVNINTGEKSCLYTLWTISSPILKQKDVCKLEYQKATNKNILPSIESCLFLKSLEYEFSSYAFKTKWDRKSLYTIFDAPLTFI
jgi:hypothetical protein